MSEISRNQKPSTSAPVSTTTPEAEAPRSADASLRGLGYAEGVAALSASKQAGYTVQCSELSPRQNASTVQHSEEAGGRVPDATAASTGGNLLATWLVSALGEGVSADRVMEEIASASQADRNAVAADSGLRSQLNSGPWSDVERSSIIAMLFEGALTWRMPMTQQDHQHLTDFERYFIYGDTEPTGPLPGTATMNCWEYIFYVAWLAGQLSVQAMRSFYGERTRTITDIDSVYYDLGYSPGMAPRKPEEGDLPNAGQLVIRVRKLTADAMGYPDHVMLSTGGDTVMSLETGPVTRGPLSNHLPSLHGYLIYVDPPWH